MGTKKEFKWFTIFEYEKEQEYLREMHKKGWRLVKVTGIGMYYFESCQPEDVIYQLDYNKEGAEYREEYVQMFQDCGWEYLLDFVGYSYFRKPVAEMNGEESIFCDDESRLEMMQRVFKGRMIPILLLFAFIVLPQFLVNVFVQLRLGMAMCYGALIVLYLSIFVTYIVKYSVYKKRVKK